MNANIEEFGKLIDAGDGFDHKATFIEDDTEEWKDIRIEISTDDCDREHAKKFKAALIALWNAQQ